MILYLKKKTSAPLTVYSNVETIVQGALERRHGWISQIQAIG